MVSRLYMYKWMNGLMTFLQHICKAFKKSIFSSKPKDLILNSLIAYFKKNLDFQFGHQAGSAIIKYSTVPTTFHA